MLSISERDYNLIKALSLSGGRGKYPAIFEIEADDIDKTIKFRRAMEAEQGRKNDSLRLVWRDVLYPLLTNYFVTYVTGVMLHPTTIG